MHFPVSWINVYNPETKRTSGRLVSIVLKQQLACDSQGFYMPRWQKNKFGMRKRVWIMYPDGLYSIFRGIKIARYQSTKRDIPSLKELQKKLSWIKFEILTPLSDQRDLYRDDNSIKVILLDSLDQLTLKQRLVLQEAYDQILMVVPLRDSRGRRNWAALAARLTAVDTRFEKAFAEIYGWQPYFSFREEKLELIRQQIIQRVIGSGKTIKVQLEADWGPNLGQLLSKKLRVSGAVEALLKFKIYRDFSDWLSFLYNDLNEFNQLIENGQTEPAKAMAEKMLLSLRLQILKNRINQQILYIEEAMIDRQIYKRQDSIRARLQKLQEQFERMDDSAFVMPVCNKVATYLEAAGNFIDHREYATAKGFLTEVMNIL